MKIFDGIEPTKNTCPNKHFHRWQAALMEMCDPYEGIRVFDYGCGYGNLANTISGAIKEFTYYGFEINTHHGRRCIEVGLRFYGSDPRVTLGLFGTEEERAAWNDCDVVILGSILTHYPQKKSVRMLDEIREKAPEASIRFTASIRSQKPVNIFDYEAVYGASGSYKETHFAENFLEEIQKLGIVRELDIQYNFRHFRHRFFSIDRDTGGGQGRVL